MKLLLVVACCCVALTAANRQSVGIEGRLRCGSKDVKDVEVKLVDVNFGRDETLASAKTDRSGRFRLTGSATELTEIDPIFKIYHNCNYDGILDLCNRKWKFTIPSKYITSGSATPAKIMDFGYVNLEIELMEEEKDCIH